MKQDKKQLWSQRIQDQKMSKLSQKHWCEENNVNFHTFCYWTSKVHASNRPPIDEPETSWVTLEKTQSNYAQSSFRISIGQAIVEINQPTEEMIHSVIRILMQHDS